MAVYTATFETGVNGNSILTSDAGSANAWSEVQDPANVALTYSNTQAYQTLSGLVTCDATGAVGYVGWTTATIVPAFSGTHYGRMYFYFGSALPSATVTPVRGFSTAGSRSWEFTISNTGVILGRDQGGTTRITFANTVSANSWFRLEWMIVQSTTAAVIEGKLFLSADSATPTETQTSSGSFSTLTETGRYRFGTIVGLVPNLVMYMDNINANDTGYPGPMVIPAPGNFAPVIYGRGAC